METYPEDGRDTVSGFPSSATTVINTDPYTCHACYKLLDLKKRDGGLFVPLHAHRDEGGVCPGSGSRVYLDDKSFLDSLEPTDKPELVIPDIDRAHELASQTSEKAGEPKPTPKYVWQAAERLDKAFADARHGNYLTSGWYFYIDRRDIETLVSHALASVRSSV